MLPIITTFDSSQTEHWDPKVDELSSFAKEEGFDCGARAAIVTQWQNITCCLFWSALFLLSDSLGFVCFSPLKYSQESGCLTNLGSKSRRVYFRPTASYYELAASFTAYSWGESPAIERMQQGGALVCESPGGSPRIGLCNVCIAFNKRSDFSCLLSQKGESQNQKRLYDKRSEKTV